ncbi:MAG: glycosyltransferase [Minisyncoccia bacterium]|jgi:glycosyltransferase involved in cell wall biosynthesis
MRLLILTQIVDRHDSNLGFFHTWIEEFAKHCEKVTVICLQEGEHALPSNVQVCSLGKPYSAKASKGAGKKFLYVFRFLKYIYKYKDEYDAVFVHMNPEYLVLGGWLWRRWKKPTGLWYAHRSDTYKLRMALAQADHVFTVSQNSFAIATPKLHAIGHGIDTELFKPAMRHESTQLRIVTAGRIAPSKHIMEMFEALQELHVRHEPFTFTVVGSPITDAEKKYAKTLHEWLTRVPWQEQVLFAGPIPHAELSELLNSQDIFFNFSTTGNMDKAGLEALACGIPLLSTNPAFLPLLKPYGLYVSSMHPKEVADALLNFMQRPNRPAVLATLRNKVVAEHSLSNLIPRILSVLTS